MLSKVILSVLAIYLEDMNADGKRPNYAKLVPVNQTQRDLSKHYMVNKLPPFSDKFGDNKRCCVRHDGITPAQSASATLCICAISSQNRDYCTGPFQKCHRRQII